VLIKCAVCAACSALVAGQARGAAGTSLRQLCLYNFLDIAAALGLALLVNMAVLLVAAATFHQAGEWGDGHGVCFTSVFANICEVYVHAGAGLLC
jgi:Mn2+/Fe2+ NRAMP family transporter